MIQEIGTEIYHKEIKSSFDLHFKMVILKIQRDLTPNHDGFCLHSHVLLSSQ